MPSKKYQKLVASDPGSYQRSRPTKTPGRSILIVTEGEVTEPLYLDELKNKYEASMVNIKVYGLGRGIPYKLAKKALQLNNILKDKATTFQTKGYDELWIVFDTDVVSESDLTEGIAFAKDNNIHIASSTPCVEFWLLLHFGYSTPCVTKSDDFIPLLRQYQFKCSKKAHELRTEIPKLMDKVDEAIRHAIRIRADHTALGTPYPANPSTDMDHLINAIRPQQPASANIPGSKRGSHSQKY